jgi:hypothetical protein
LEFSSSDEDDASVSLNSNSAEQPIPKEINRNEKKGTEMTILTPKI